MRHRLKTLMAASVRTYKTCGAEAASRCDSGSIKNDAASSSGFRSCNAVQEENKTVEISYTGTGSHLSVYCTGIPTQCAHGTGDTLLVRALYEVCYQTNRTA
jgi:hypothetical protein